MASSADAAAVQRCCLDDIRRLKIPRDLTLNRNLSLLIAETHPYRARDGIRGD